MKKNTGDLYTENLIKQYRLKHPIDKESKERVAAFMKEFLKERGELMKRLAWE